MSHLQVPKPQHEKLFADDEHRSVILYYCTCKLMLMFMYFQKYWSFLSRKITEFVLCFLCLLEMTYIYVHTWQGSLVAVQIMTDDSRSKKWNRTIITDMADQSLRNALEGSNKVVIIKVTLDTFWSLLNFVLFCSQNLLCVMYLNWWFTMSTICITRFLHMKVFRLHVYKLTFLLEERGTVMIGWDGEQQTTIWPPTLRRQKQVF